jgi:hypothetical protein
LHGEIKNAYKSLVRKSQENCSSLNVLDDGVVSLIYSLDFIHHLCVLQPQHFEEKRPKRPKCRGEDNIKMDFKFIECGGMHWILLAQNRV